jgi:ABC-2 type transport system permease protein
MKAFAALIHREFIEHKGAFFFGPLILVALMLGATVLAFTVGRVDARFSGQMFTVAPLRIFEMAFMAFSLAWLLYLIATLFFYCADGFAADKRNNSMLFWKSMPVSDLRMLWAKLTAAITILPGSIFGITMLSGLLLFAIIFVTTIINGTGSLDLFGSVAGIYVNVALAFIVTLVCGLLWYLPYMALVGALATAIGRWAIPLAVLLPAIISTLEWVTLGGFHPLATVTSAYLEYRSDFPLMEGYIDDWLVATVPFDGLAYSLALIGRLDWNQVLIGIAFAALAIYLASEYRRRVNDN